MPQYNVEVKPKPTPSNLVSVLMPCFNHEHYVVDALQSIADSSYESLELMFIDDASVDESFCVAKKWLDANAQRFARVVFERHKINRGITKTLNELVSHAQGRFIAFLASDDLLVADGISKQVSCALNSNAGFIFADARLIDESGKTISDSAIRHFGRNPRHLMRRNCLIIDVLLNWEAPWTRVFASADLISKIGMFDENLKFEDRDFIVRVLSHGSFALLPEAVYCYRLRLQNRLTPGLDLVSMRRDYLWSENKNFQESSGLIRLVLGLNVLAGRVRFDRNGMEKSSQVWPLFASIRKLLSLAHLAAMRF